MKSFISTAGDQTTISIEVPKNGESFSVQGLMVTDRAWLAVYNKYEVRT